MKTQTLILFVIVLALFADKLSAELVGRAFTYQGRLNDNGVSADGYYDLKFTLYDSAGGANVVNAPLTNAATPVSNGLFTVMLDFGAGAYNGDARWLEIGVRTNGSPTNFVLLTPRQPLTATPYARYAVTAANASTAAYATSVGAGTVDNTALATASVDSSKIADGAVAPSDLNPVLQSNTFWRLDGNAGTVAGVNFLGTLDNRPLEMRVQGRRAFRLEPGTNATRDFGFSPNVIGGYEGNVIGADVVGATIAGGGREGYVQTITAPHGSIGGGDNNTVNGEDSTIGGGGANVINGSYAFIGGGLFNTVGTNAYYGKIGGGLNNTISNDTWSATIGGGYNNIASASDVTIGGGKLNQVAGDTATVGGGALNTAGGIAATVGGGSGNIASNTFATVAGGTNNTAGGNAATVAGGRENTASGWFSAIGGGGWNTASDNSATVGGGEANTASAQAATVPGGQMNTAAGLYSFGAGRRAQALHDGSFVWGDGTWADFTSTGSNQFLIRAGGGVGIGTNNPQTALHVAGTITADNLIGSGSGLTGISGSALAAGSITSTQIALDTIMASNIESDQIVKSVNGLRDEVTITAGANITLATNGNALQIATAYGGGSTGWNTNGNAGTDPANGYFLGTTDNQSLELRVNSRRALRLEPTLEDASHGNIVNVVGGSTANQVKPGVYGAVIAGGGAGNWFGHPISNRVDADFGNIGGGGHNTIEIGANASTIGGGEQNLIQTNAVQSSIGGGWLNVIQSNALASSILGGWNNTIQTDARQSTIGGGVVNRIETDADYSTIGGGNKNIIQTNADYSTIAGGDGNTIQADVDRSTIGGGWNNRVGSNARFSTISGGLVNEIGIGAYGSTIGGGEYNKIGTFAIYATIGGGSANSIQTNAYNSTIGGGNWNTVRSEAIYSTIGGGLSNTISGDYSTIPGGLRNEATNNAFAAGSYAKAVHSGAFVWGDTSTNIPVISGTNNSVTMRAAGGTRVFTDSAMSAGVYLASGSGSWTSLSDRNAKEQFAPVDGRKILQKVVALPLTTWSYKTQDKSVRHIGPVAQDFKAAFDVGESETGITTIDADGVALAAIQGLNQKLDDRVKKLESENTELKAQLAELKNLVHQLAQQK